MQSEPLVFVGTSDLSGLVRGKAFPEAALAARLREGVGLTHSHIMLSAFGPIYDTPFGTEGDLMLLPDPATLVEVDFAGTAAERFYLGDILTLDGKPWECCPRHFLRRALHALEAEAGLGILAAFEQEFVYTGIEDRPGATYSLDAYRRQGAFGEAYAGALRAGGLIPDSFLPEYGARQFEITIAPTRGMRAADEAVIQRELARGVATRMGHRAIFAPMIEPDGIGNGTHIHFSLRDTHDRPVFYDPSRLPYRLSRIGEQFVAGLLDNLPSLSAITAPSAVSYQRLQPNRWAPTWANVAVQDRGASIRICPIFGPPAAHVFNVEFRVADAAASPYMALGALVWAGLDGIRRKLTLPPEPDRDFWSMSEAERVAQGARPLPRSLGEALDNLAGNPAAVQWLGEPLFNVYMRFKRAENQLVAGLSPEEICARYAEIY